MTPTADSDPTVCRKCGAKALPGQEFSEPGQPGPYLCPDCARGSVITGGLSMLAAWAVMPLGALALISAAGDAARAGWVVLNLTIGWMIGVLLTIPHELAHALVARLCGLRVGRIVVGYGPVVFRVHPGFPAEWRLIPLGGYFQRQPRKGRTPPLHDFWISAAGPLSHLVMIGAGWGLMGFPSITTFDPSRGLTPGWMFLGWNLTAFFWNAVPFVATMEGTRLVGNDGLQALAALYRLRRNPDTYPPFGPAVPPTDPVPERPSAAGRITVWLCFAAGLIGLMVTASNLDGSGRLTTGEWARLIGWGLLAGICLPLGLRLEALMEARPLSRRLKAPESSGELLRELTRREYAAAVPPERRRAVNEALDKCAGLHDAEAWPALRDALRQCLESCGHHPALQHWLARTLIRTEELPAARELLQALLEADGIGPATAATTVLYLTEVESLAEDAAALAAHVDEFVRLEPSASLRLAVLAQAAAIAWEKPFPALRPAALEWADQMLEIQPGATAFLTMKSVLLAEEGRFGESAAASEAASQRHPAAEVHALRCFAEALRTLAAGDRAAGEKLLSQAQLLSQESWLEKRAAEILRTVENE